MTYKPGDEQQEIIDADDAVLLVCGGAGTGKTTTAAAAVRAHLERVDQQRVAELHGRERRPAARALFLSFSRSSVAQILDRTAEVLGPYQSRVEITTFHAFAWRLLTRWGAVIGLTDPQMRTETEAKLFRADDAVRYQDMLPRALELCAVPAVREHLQARWSIIVSDEFQDTDDRQFELLTTIRGEARLLLLGDPNQCIYSTLPGVVGVGPERLDAAMALGARRLDLPDVSHRDPSNILPAAAAAIRRREFTHDAVTAALDSGRLQVRAGLPLNQEADVVAETVQRLREEGHTVGVFSHHIDATTGLSDQLTQRGINHEIIGLPECLTAALEAQHTMVRFAAGVDDWDLVRQQLAVFVTSSVRGRQAPDLAWMLLGRPGMPATLDRRLTELREALLADGTADAAEHAAGAHATLGLTRGQSHWHSAARLLQPLVARHLRRHPDPADALEHLAAAIDTHRTGLLTHTVGEPATPVQLMGLYQTKGREADATIVVLRSNDFYGSEKKEPFDTGSKLLYVVLSRARHKTVVLLFGDDPQPLVAPLVKLAS
ncbi:AAA family ATPase [Phytohabitans sp. ZYX-F-186]|uniref:AAA family ATPase n=1 Tax=Phytohabitans maris TaxID=3071409 RepID=A0ABU0ZRX8_9ACTN|nr:UvrD-helicase domain-containing protein [Phytohabitans sp. ZYX-F-186]MDQ7909084.1 AAA family ATPase [Phytohabitans sp. ZYX-F-186]